MTPQTQKIRVATFYRYFDAGDLTAGREWLVHCANEHAVFGLLLFGGQGINATVSGNSHALDTFISKTEAYFQIKFDNVKYSPASKKPFWDFRVRMVQELIKFGHPEADPKKRTGQYVQPKEWNALIEREDVTLVDTRNRYELKTGKFSGAIDPKIGTFSEFAKYADEHLSPESTPKVAMYCTGGIRCEVATSYLLAKGFQEVYHLEGGILKYLEDIPKDQSRWEGECFVFDHRVCVGHDLNQGTHLLCHACGWPMSPDEMLDKRYEQGVSCTHCHDSQTPERRESMRERVKQRKLDAERGILKPWGVKLA